MKLTLWCLTIAIALRLAFELASVLGVLVSR
jgi:hypothetical protein